MANNIKVVTDATFEQEVLRNDKPVLVDFWATWCGPCRMVAPVVEQIASEYSEKLQVAKLDVDQNPDVAMKYGIMSIPTLMIFRDGKIAQRMVGYMPKETMKKYVDSVV